MELNSETSINAVPLYASYHEIGYRNPTGNQIGMAGNDILSIPLSYPNAKFAKVTISQFVLLNDGAWISTASPSYGQEHANYISPLNSSFIIPKIESQDASLITADVCKYGSVTTSTGNLIFYTNYVHMRIFNNNFIISISGYPTYYADSVRLDLNLVGVAEIYY